MLLIVEQKKTDAFPSHAGSYYILSYLLYIVNRFEDALDVMDLGRVYSSTFQPFNGKLTPFNTNRERDY